MYGFPGSRGNSSNGVLAPANFRDSARNAIFLQLPVLAAQSSASSVRSAPLQFRHLQNSLKLRHSLALSVFSCSRRSVRLAPSLYSSSTATIPEDCEPTTTTVEQLINDILLHENFCKEKLMERKALLHTGGPASPQPAALPVADDEYEEIKISLGSDLNYQNVPESLVDWNLNVTRCKLMVTAMPLVSSSPDLVYSDHLLPQLVGDLAQICHVVLLQPYITDKELIHTLYSSNLYVEHNLDASFRKSVAEISVKQSRLLQINQQRKHLPSPPITPSEQTFLGFKYKEIAIRNYLVNLAAAATTAYEYKLQSDAVKRDLKRLADGERKKLTKEEKKALWDSVRMDVFKRAGLEE
ncbi:hypothetical protein METBIDRAFT_78746 [Metschnikowia bicuspidata var. bicuspidata NRRL YB-4993]|uniref:Uncharacterized protein n=1 Tax=Metschnikowia bicuspidata var. bicuspidata NRRL YB-4993 TaxID=869754 RepID=A0A1A0H8W7_9ASCO|nr:hypothetical protein METBIDRAFT_78746 [Metschnikowia bicuspidata var. bicuspidata NRRL YB-4993]OBA20327.1 hypothetical protein METBIDRAFT_78746 [Metschnikowia bicuspidata var. bicuspidata NRRL YB-4993]